MELGFIEDKRRADGDCKRDLEPNGDFKGDFNGDGNEPDFLDFDGVDAAVAVVTVIDNE